MTEGMKGAKDCLFFLTGESEDEKPQKSERKKASTQPRANGSPAKKTAGTKVLRNNRRAAQDEVHQTAAAKLAEHQRELHEKLQAEGLAKYSEEGGGTKKEEKGWKKFQSYKGDGALPPDIDKLRVISIAPLCPDSALIAAYQIVVDRKALTIILPIYGYAVPFHINTIKNVSKNDEGDYTYLRINFQTPGQLAGKKEDTVGHLRPADLLEILIDYAVAFPRSRRHIHSLRIIQINGRAPL